MKVTDGLGRTVALNSPPMRIISLVPSLTELLFELGLEENLVGVTKFCTRPTHAREVAKSIGGTKKFNFGKIDELKPDLIIANKEENYKQGVEALADKYPIYISDIFNLDDAITTIKDLGILTDRKEATGELCEGILDGFTQVKNTRKGSALYFIWQSPDMVAGSNNFIDFTLTWLGLENAASHKDRYPQMLEKELHELSPDYVLLSSEPYPFKRKHLKRFEVLFPTAQILLVDGEMFSWYGSRLKYAPNYFDTLPLQSND